MHFSEIVIKPQFEEERHTLLCILELFTNIIHQLSLKNAWLPPICFWILITLVRIYISCIIINRGKNTFEFVACVFRSLFKARTSLICLLEILFEVCPFLVAVSSLPILVPSQPWQACFNRNTSKSE